MDNPREEINFICRITGSVTHELQNVLAIIRESSGLVEDLLSCADQQVPLPLESIKRSFGLIDRQIEKGSGLIAHLNRFSHNADETTMNADLHMITKQLAALSRRFLVLKDLALDIHDPQEPMPISSSK